MKYLQTDTKLPQTEIRTKLIYLSRRVRFHRLLWLLFRQPSPTYSSAGPTPSRRTWSVWWPSSSGAICSWYSWPWWLVTTDGFTTKQTYDSSKERRAGWEMFSEWKHVSKRTTIMNDKGTTNRVVIIMTAVDSVTSYLHKITYTPSNHDKIWYG